MPKIIGSAVCVDLARSCRVFGFDRPGAPHPPPQAINVSVDLTDDASVTAGFEQVRREAGGRIASVIHLAAYYDFSGEDSPLYQTLTVAGTRRLLRQLQSFDAEQFVFSSTMLVHAPCEPGQKINEDWPIQPKWAYPQSKVEAERMIGQERGGIPAVMLRIAGVYDDGCHSIPIAHQIARIDRGELTSRVFPGSTSHGQAFVHNDDVVEAIRRCVERRQALPPNVPILIGEDLTLTYDELQHTIARLLKGQSFETMQIPELVAKAGARVQDVWPGTDPFIKPWMIPLADDHYELDITRARTLLSWQPKHSLRQTLPRMIAHLRSDPIAWYRENYLEPPESGRTQQVPPPVAGEPDAPDHQAR